MVDATADAIGSSIYRRSLQAHFSEMRLRGWHASAMRARMRAPLTFRREFGYTVRMRGGSEAAFRQICRGLGGLMVWMMCACATAAPWEPIGPDGGDRFMVKLSPATPQTVFVLGYHGIHRSRDGGETWTFILDAPMPFDTWLDLAFAQQNPQVLFAAGASGGVWSSVDEGDSWTPRRDGLPAETRPQRYFPVTGVSFSSEGALLAALSQADTDERPPAPIYASTNAGVHWFSFGDGIPYGTATGKVVTLLSTDAASQVWASVRGLGVFRAGVSGWSDRTGDLPPAGRRVTGLAHDPVDPDHLYAGTEDDWVYTSRNGGVTWSRLPLPAQLADLSIPPLTYTIATDPNNTNLVVVRANDTNGSVEHPLFRPRAGQDSGAGLYLSPDGGTSWTRLNIFAFRLAPDPSETVSNSLPGLGPVTRTKTWFRTAGGRESVLRSTNGMLTFEVKTRGIESVWFNSVWVHPSPPPGLEQLVLGASEDGLFLSSNAAANAWSYAVSADSPVYTWSFARDYADDAAVYYATGNPAWRAPQRRGLYRIPLACFDAHCPPADNQLLSDVSVWRVITTPANSNWIYLACQEAGVRFSPDRGATWVPINLGFNLPISVTDLVLDDNGLPLLAAVRASSGDPNAVPPQPWPPQDNEAGGVAVISGDSWTNMPGIDRAVFDLEVIPGATQAVVAATSGGVYSYALGSGWQRRSAEVLVNDVLVDTQRPTTWYGATRLGVIRSTDGGQQWHDFSTGLRVRIAYALAQSADDGTLYAGLEGGSIARRAAETNPVPTMATDVDTLDYGMVPVGYAKRLGLRVTNVGEANVMVTNLTPEPAGFALEGPPLLPASITPGSWMDLTIALMPSNALPVAGTLTIDGNASNAPVTVTLSGHGYTETGELAVAVDPDTAPWTLLLPWGAASGRIGDQPAISVPTGGYVVTWQELAGYHLPTNQPAFALVATGLEAIVFGQYAAIQPGLLALETNWYVVREDAGSLVVGLVRTNGSEGVVSVSFLTEADSAQAGADFGAASGIVTFADGQSGAAIPLTIINDHAAERAEEFRLWIGQPTGGAALGDPTGAVIRIQDGDLGEDAPGSLVILH